MQQLTLGALLAYPPVGPVSLKRLALCFVPDMTAFMGLLRCCLSRWTAVRCGHEAVVEGAGGTAPCTPKIQSYTR